MTQQEFNWADVDGNGKSIPGVIHCGCWKTDRYIWTPKCPVHPVKDPWAYSIDELLRISADAERGVFPETQRRGD